MVMQITVDGVDLYQISDNEIELLEYLIPSASLDADLKRRLQWVLTHKIEQAYVQLKKDWMPILQADETVVSIPKTDEAFFNAVKVRPDYQDRDERDAEINP